ncbi:UNVERIFIED_CONTAM: hypothetical protein Sradi_5045000, partial [Sesamum radiatum]
TRCDLHTLALPPPTTTKLNPDSAPPVPPPAAGYQKNPPARLRPSAPPTEPSSDARHHRAACILKLLRTRRQSGSEVAEIAQKSPQFRRHLLSSIPPPFRGVVGSYWYRSTPLVKGKFPLNQFEVSSRIEAGLTHLSPFTSDVDSPSSERKSISDHHRWTRLVVARRLRPFP